MIFAKVYAESCNSIRSFVFLSYGPVYKLQLQPDFATFTLFLHINIQLSTATHTLLARIPLAKIK